MDKQSGRRTTIRTGVTALAFALLTIGMFGIYFFPQTLSTSTNGSATLVVPANTPTFDEDGVNEAGEAVVAGKPVRIIIHTASIDLPVVDGIYDEATGEWSLSDNAAHYAVVTPIANNVGGNTFVYGHNRSSVFASLLKASIGDEARVETENGHALHYVLRSVKDVEPTDVSLFQYEGKPILTVQTCSGAWYENRRLFTFELTKVEAAS